MSEMNDVQEYDIRGKDRTFERAHYLMVRNGQYVVGLAIRCRITKDFWTVIFFLRRGGKSLELSDRGCRDQRPSMYTSISFDLPVRHSRVADLKSLVLSPRQRLT